MADSITRKSFFGALAGAAALPLAAVPAAIVTQAELNAIREANIHMDRLLAAVKVKLNAGATVEPGPLTALTDGGPIYDADPGSLQIDGVDIGPREEIEPHAAELEAITRRVGQPDPNVITQTELRSFAAGHTALERRAVAIQSRMFRGATVEPGPVTVEWDGEPGEFSGRWIVGANIADLNIEWEEIANELKPVE